MSSTTNETKQFILNKPYIVHETIEGETIVMNLKNGFYYSFDGIGPAIWELILHGASSDEIINLMEETFPEPGFDMKSVVLEFIGLLKENEIIFDEPARDSKSIEFFREQLNQSNVFSGISVRKPLFHRFTDMRDVLLLDPIHDVDVKGWPEPKLK